MIPDPVAHGKKAATEGFIRASIRSPRIGTLPLTHRFASACRTRIGHMRIQVRTMRPLAMNRWTISQTDSRSHIDTCVPIFVSPATTITVCLMVFGVLHAVAIAGAERVAIDGLLAINASLYVAAALLAKAALRRRASTRCFRLARHANRLSIAALIMTIIGVCCVVLVIAIRA